MISKKRHALYSNIGIALLGKPWMSISFITAMPIGVLFVILMFRVFELNSMGYAVLSIVGLTFLLAVFVVLPFLGWGKYRLLKEQHGKSEVHRYVRWLKKNAGTSFTFKN
ncbi:TPA: hypothetical protein NJM71_003456 [Vibrio cholerae]|nr:hypothetical protein [Vibrio cholerae]HCG1911010.1 hypothetical protein [Vibrio cholerae]